MHQHRLHLTKRLTGVKPASETSAHSPANAESVVVADLLRSLTGALDGLAKRSQATRADIAELSVELGIAVAERLLASRIASDRQRLDRIVLAMLERVQSKQSIAIEANPADIAILKVQIQDSPEFASILDSCTFTANGALERGRLKLETNEMFVEWDTRRCLAEMRTLLLDEAFMDAQ